jgi:hypothetical protein
MSRWDRLFIAHTLPLKAMIITVWTGGGI